MRKSLLKTEPGQHNATIAGFSLSRAIAQRSLGPGAPVYPLYPALVAGCPQTASATIQYPLQIDYDLEGFDAEALFAAGIGTGLERWAPLLPPLARGLSMGEGGTPLLELPRSAFGMAEGGRRLFLKDESRNPTGSHKDRLNLCTISAAMREGAKGIVVASSGNHGTSTAAYAARANLPCIVLTMPTASAAFQAMLRAYGAMPIAVPAEARWPLVRKLWEDFGFYPTSNLTDVHTGHPFGPEGYKTIAYEIFLDLGRTVPAAVVAPTGYAEQLFGIHKGFVELARLGLSDRVPRMISVEPEARGPLHAAIAGSRPVASVAPGKTCQLSIACTTGGYRGVHAIKASRGYALKVSDQECLAAQSTLGKLGLWQEVSGAAGVAAVRQLDCLDVDAGAIVAIGCSSGLKDPHPEGRLGEIEPEIDAVLAELKRQFGFNLDSQRGRASE